jgi:hypothetical protein
MRKMLVGLTASLAMAFAAPALADTITDEVQESEQPGSAFELDVDDDGKVEFGRQRDLENQGGGAPGGNPLEIGDEDTPLLDPLDDPDMPDDPDPIDEELPGEGPESLSGPDDDDPLPY